MQPRPDMNSVPSGQDLEGLHYGRVPDPLALEGVDRFTFPVRDLDKAERFYTQVLGGEVVQREFTEIGLHEQLAIGPHWSCSMYRSFSMATPFLSSALARDSWVRLP